MLYHRPAPVMVSLSLTPHPHCVQSLRRMNIEPCASPTIYTPIHAPLLSLWLSARHFVLRVFVLGTGVMSCCGTTPQPFNAQPCHIATRDVISSLLGMPPSFKSSVTPSRRRYERGIERGDDLHQTESQFNTRPQTRASHRRKHERGDVTPRAPLGGFGSSEMVHSNHAARFPFHHSASSALYQVQYQSSRLYQCLPNPHQI
jgi:hypothetical protein